MAKIIKRILGISDIHGCYDELVCLLDKVKYNPAADQLILLGDYTDRGFKSKQVLDKVIQLVEEGAIALRGNHCQMFLDWLTLTDDYAAINFFSNGGFQTVESYVGYNWFEAGYEGVRAEEAREYICKHYKDHIELLSKLPYYFETEDFIFVHAGINPHLDDWKQSTKESMIWIREEFLDNLHQQKKFVVHGHTPSKYLHGSHDIFHGDWKIGIDGACAYGGQLNCLEIKDGQLKQYSVKKGEKK